MAITNNGQRHNGLNHIKSGVNGFFSEKICDISNIAVDYQTGSYAELKSHIKPFSGINLLAGSHKSESTCFPEKETRIARCKIPGTETDYHAAETGCFNNEYLNETAARLSDIELAIYNYDVYAYQNSIHNLLDLFIKMNIPAATSIARKMEELSNENKIEELLSQMQVIKKFIAQLFQPLQTAKIW